MLYHGDIDHSVIEAIGKSGRRIEDYVKGSTIGLVSVDYFYYKKILEDLDPPKALELYTHTWDQNIEREIKSCSSKMGISKVDDVPTLGRITRSLFDDRCRPLKEIEDTSERYVGIVTICPFVEYTKTIFNQKVGCPYHRLLAKHSDTFLNLLVDVAGLKGRVTAKQDKFMCEGDNICRIILEKKHQ